MEGEKYDIYFEISIKKKYEKYLKLYKFIKKLMKLLVTNEKNVL